MRRLFLITALLSIFCLLSLAQVSFTPSVKQTAVDEITVSFSGKIADGWHVYSQDEKNGPTPASINISSIKGAKPIGTLRADRKPAKKFDEIFNAEVMYYEGQVVFSQKFRLTGGDYSVEGYFEYGACNDQSCLPPTSVDFSFKGEGAKETSTTSTTSITRDTSLTSKTSTTSDTSKTTITSIPTKPEEISPAQPATEASAETFSLWTIFLLGLLGGFVAILTPCVWPIIPMTVSFFIKRGNRASGKQGTERNTRGFRDAVIYGISIIVIYLSLGLIVTALFGASALNALSTNAFFNIFFFLLLLVFGISLLGAFEMVLPSSWVNYVNKKSEEISAKSDSSLFTLHSSLSIFLMAFTLVLVSFSCTAPIVGFLLVELGTTGNVMGAAVGMFGFAVALALPFMLFAAFPTLLKAAPKSGSWMNSVKVTLGIIEIAFSLKFLSVADLAYGWHILDREVFLIIWIILFFLLGCYYLSHLPSYISHRLSAKSQQPTAKVIHSPLFTLHSSLFTLSALLAFAFVAYMVPGLWGAPCKAISAFTPPMSTQHWNIYADDDAKGTAGTIENPYRDFDEGMKAAQAAGKPIMIDFTGYGCVNCRKMEAAVWTDSEVKSIINNDYILIQLFVDDKTALPQPVKVTENGQTRTLRTIGDKWSYFQRSQFGHNTQPFYVLLDPRNTSGSKNQALRRNILQEPRSYDEDIPAYVRFLRSGLSAYQNK